MHAGAANDVFDPFAELANKHTAPAAPIQVPSSSGPHPLHPAGFSGAHGADHGPHLPDRRLSTCNSRGSRCSSTLASPQHSIQAGGHSLPQHPAPGQGGQTGRNDDPFADFFSDPLGAAPSTGGPLAPGGPSAAAGGGGAARPPHVSTSARQPQGTAGGAGAAIGDLLGDGDLFAGAAPSTQAGQDADVSVSHAEIASRDRTRRLQAPESLVFSP